MTSFDTDKIMQSLDRAYSIADTLFALTYHKGGFEQMNSSTMVNVLDSIMDNINDARIEINRTEEGIVSEAKNEGHPTP